MAPGRREVLVDRAALNPERLHLGWQHALVHPDPGPPPRRPTPPEQHRVHPQWMEEQRREERRLNRPLELAGALALGMAAFFGILGWPLGAVPGWGAAVAIGICLVLAGVAAYAVWQGQRALRARLSEEQQRRERLRVERDRRLRAAQEDHARRFDDWRARKAAFDAQHEWHAVALPRDVPRIDVAGGTPAGWRALLTTLGASCLEGGSEVTVVDLSENAVAGDLVALRSARDRQVWILPEDSPQLDLAAGLDAEALADALALFVSVSENGSQSRHLAVDRAILGQLLEVIGDEASVSQVTAALRVVVQGADESADADRGQLTDEQVRRLVEAFGRGGPGQPLRDRGPALEAQLRTLGAVGSEGAHTDSGPLRVLATDGAGEAGSAALGTYVTMTLLHEFRRRPRQHAWSRGLFVCGAEVLRGDVLDRLHDACEATGTGLVTMYRSIPPYVKGRLGRGGAAVAFMQPASPADAGAASEHIGTGRRLRIHELSQLVSDVLPARGGEDYAGTRDGRGSTGDAASAATVSGGGDARGSTAETAPPASEPSGSGKDTPSDARPGAAGAEGLVPSEDLMTRTSWGRATSRVVSGDEPAAQVTRRSREFVAEPDELEALPASAFILCRDTPAGRQVTCGDANPALASLPRATRGELADTTRGTTISRPVSGPEGSFPAASSAPGGTASGTRDERAGEEGAGGENGTGTPYGSASPQRSSKGTEPPDRDELADLPPNLGPPPQRLDWRNPR